jgi:hypothetical protein
MPPLGLKGRLLTGGFIGITLCIARAGGTAIPNKAHPSFKSPEILPQYLSKILKAGYVYEYQ